MDNMKRGTTERTQQLNVMFITESQLKTVRSRS